MKFIATITAGCFALTLMGCNPAETEKSYFPLPKNKSKIVKSESQSYIVDTVVTGLIRPWSIAFLPEQKVLIAERSRLLLVKNGIVQEKPVGGEVPKNLRDIKLHPNYKENGWLYISYYVDPTEKDGGYTALLRGKLVGDSLVNTSVLYKAGPFKENGEWFGSKIAFDKKGYLYFTVGVRGERKNSLDMANPSGKTMRLNDDGTIPSDNPFIKIPGVLPEIYTYGHRMHEGMAQNPQTGKIWSSEFGEMAGDEINILERGANYGWPEVTFSREYNGKAISADSLRDDVEPPIFQTLNAPSDIEFVFGNHYPNWDGNLFIGGLARRLLLRVVFKDNKVVHNEPLLEGIGRVRDVKYAPDNYLYLVTEDTGLMVRIIPVKESL